MTRPISVRYPHPVRDLDELRAEVEKAAHHGRVGACGWFLMWDGKRLVRWDEALALVSVIPPNASTAPR